MHQVLRLFSFTALLLFAFMASANAQGNFQFSEACNHDETVFQYGTGATELTTCAGDGTNDRIRFTVSRLFMAFGYVVVDENDIIVHIGSSNFINFEMLPSGPLRVYAFTHFGLITGQVGENINDAVLSRPCFDLTDNFVSVNNASPGDVEISTPSGETVFNTCPGDGNADEISFLSNGTLANSAFIVTNEDNVVLAINTSGTIDFDDAPAGICRVYAANFAGDLMLEVGDDLDNANVSDACGGVSENYITVIREGIVGGTVSLENGGTEVLTCPGDGVDDIVNMTNNGGSGSNFAYLITDENNIVIAVAEGDELNFEVAPVGVCRVWGLSYEGNITTVAGDDAATTELADGCFALSNNFVTVTRNPAEGGTIAAVGGADEVATCPGDGNPDLVSFEATGADGGSYTLVVTDTNNVILAIPGGNEVDFEGAGVGVCRVWGLSYQGELQAEAGDNAATATLASSCSDLSDNYVTVVRENLSAGTVATADGETEITICPEDELADLVEFVSEGAEGSNFTFVVTDENNVILGVPGDNSVDFSGAGLGVCRLWGLTYEGNLLAMVGDNAAETVLADACYALSDNFVTVNRIEPNGGTIATEEGATEVVTCPGDGIADVVSFASDGAIGASYAYVITDENGSILGVPGGNTVDFESAQPGNCRVYGLAYSGVITAGVGTDVNTVQLASGCFDLTENYVSIVRIASTAGTVITEDGLTEVRTCPGDGNPDLIAFDSTGTNLSNFSYLITDDNGVVLGVLNGDRFNFDIAGPGTCRLYGFGYEGTSLAGPGDTIGVSQLATECAVVSDNWVTVIREAPTGGTVSIEGGGTEAFICPGDMISDVIEFDSTDVGGGAYTYIVTDTNNVILGIPSGDAVDFDAAGFGTCRLWGLSYQGDLQAVVGDNAAETVLATGCYALSDNYVTVVRDDLTGGTIITASSVNEVFTCPGDGVDDIVDVVINGSSNGNSVYVITDENNNILDISDSPSINFEGAGEGVCRVWGLVYTGDLSAAQGDNASTAQLATGCFSLTSNYVNVVRTVPAAGTITTPNGASVVDVCSGDGTADVVEFSIDGASNGGYTYVFVQEGVILAGYEDDSFDFENATAGTYYIYGLAYAGTPNLPIGASIEETQLASSCYDLTDQFITVNVERVDGCELSVVGSESDVVYLCSSNPDDGFIEFFSCSSLTDSNYQYVITTADDVILFLMDGPSFDFSNVPLPEARVYAISYTGTLNELVGTTITSGDLSSTGCFDVTDNYITIINGQPEAGTISLSPSTPEPFCVANGNGTVVIETTSTSNVGYAIIVTTPGGEIVQISQNNSADFNDLPSGDYLIFGASYTGNLTISEGDDINLVAIADNCFELTQAPLQFFRAGEIDGGVVSTQFGTDSLYVCPSDGLPDILAVNTTAEGVAYRYLVTDGLGNIIVPESFSNVFNFEGAPEGICRVYGYAITGNITATFGDNVETAMLTDSCFALSENYITVIRQNADGGNVTTETGDTVVTVDLSSDATTITMNSENAANLIGFTYVITDDNNFVLGFGEGPTFDFAGAPAGVCRVWGLSYHGELSLQIGDSADTSALATGCFSLSENFVEVTRTNGDGFNDNNSYDALGNNNINLTAYPNPISGGQLQVIIESENVLSDGQAFLRDQNGRTYANQFVAGGTKRANIGFDINQLPAGLFIVQYVAGDELRVVRVMKQ